MLINIMAFISHNAIKGFGKTCVVYIEEVKGQRKYIGVLSIFYYLGPPRLNLIYKNGGVNR